ncbi:MAG: isoaspartyl peptidase/L-asparaginase [Bacteroidia bacterium]
MKKFLLIFVLMLIQKEGAAPQERSAETKRQPIAIVIHGGAGNMNPDNISPEKRKQYEAVLREALIVGYETLEKRGSLDAVEAVITMLENSPLFNAGKGAVMTNEGKNELDASIMYGKDLMAGAVAGVTTVKNPIKAARAVMEKSPHVMMAGEGAEKFADQHGLELVDPEYFYNEERYEELERIKDREGQQQLDEGSLIPMEFEKMGTVGCVALDRDGNIAAGTSTGGMTNKRFGRIGDSPVIGAGTYADNSTAGISCTGHGEYFIRLAVAYDITAIMKYRQESLESAAKQVVKKLSEMGGKGGVIGLDRRGNVAMVFNTSGMFRGYLKEGEKPVVRIFED